MWMNIFSKLHIIRYIQCILKDVHMALRNTNGSALQERLPSFLFLFLCSGKCHCLCNLLAQLLDVFADFVRHFQRLYLARLHQNRFNGFGTDGFGLRRDGAEQ